MDARAPRELADAAPALRALVAAAGPLSNLLMAYLASFPLRLGLISTNFMTYFTMVFIQLNLLLMIFNLLPLAPLDGYQVTVGLLPREWAISIARFERQGPLLLMLLIVAGSMFHFDLLGMIISPPFRLLVNLLLPT